MTLVFILNTYAEHGPEDIRVAASPEAMLRIFDECAANDIKTATEAKWLPRYLSETKLALTKARSTMEALMTAPAVGSTGLMSGWGGYQLHIVEIET